MSEVAEQAAQAPPQIWQYGILGVIAFVFAGVIVYLFKRYERREKRLDAERALIVKERAEWQAVTAKERADWQAERVEIRAEYEMKHRIIIEQSAKELREDRDAAREHEDLMRREYAELMENVAAEAAKSSAATTAVLDKLYERFVGPRRHY